MMEIVRALRQMGCSVCLLHQVGGGCPDLLVGRQGRNYLLEVKSPKGRMEKTQEEWHAAWKGSAHVVRSVDEAFKAVGMLTQHEESLRGVRVW